ncbi:effector-associated domain EAD1-containing protein [Frankia nepalensis]|uniref:effector-associated domain EAD1-containing protein n=2 Tax=Frankia nepalensis TaxID=1836974 RepID=UPI00396A2DF4
MSDDRLRVSRPPRRHLQTSRYPTCPARAGRGAQLLALPPNLSQSRKIDSPVWHPPLPPVLQRAARPGRSLAWSVIPSSSAAVLWRSADLATCLATRLGAGGSCRVRVASGMLGTSVTGRALLDGLCYGGWRVARDLSGREVQALAEMFGDSMSAGPLLASVGLPRRNQPTWSGLSAEEFWWEVSRLLTAGAVRDGRRRLFE